MISFLDYALKYAELGWHIFPLKPGTKVPITKHGVLNATTDEKQIRAWWKRWPTANIAVACGAKSGVHVIDVDVDPKKGHPGWESLKEFPSLPATIRQDTPRGGAHFFYCSDEPPRNQNNFRPNIDIRSDGYYVVLPPSIHPDTGTAYEWTVFHSPWKTLPTEYPDFMRPGKKSTGANRSCIPVSGMVDTASVPQGPADPEITRDEYLFALESVGAPIRTPQGPFSSDQTRSAIILDEYTTPPSELARKPPGGDLLLRASRYLATCDAAVQGQGGHDKLLWAAQCLVNGWGLSDNQALDLLTREFNPRCMPPWDLGIPSEAKDFARKIDQAKENPPRSKSHLWLRNDPEYPDSSMPDVQIDVGKLIASIQQDPRPVEAKIAANELEFLVAPTGLLGDICSWINSTAIKDQPFLTLACTLSFLGVLFGRKIKDSLGTRSNIYCMGVARSSAGKDIAPHQIRRLCSAAGTTHLLAGDDIASDSAIEEQMSRDPASLFLLDEIGHLLAHIKSGTSPHHARVVSLFMRLYSASRSVYKGRVYADREQQRTLVQPCCCIYGTTSPERFIGGISPEQLQDGWLSRCLVFYSPTDPPKIRGRLEQDVPRHIIESVNMWAIREVKPESENPLLSDFVTTFGDSQPPLQVVIPTTPGAERIFCAFEDVSRKKKSRHDGAELLWAKAEENARRIALIIAAGESFESPVITESIADYSTRLVSYLLVSFSKVFIPEIVSGNTEASKRKLRAAINSKGIEGCSMRDLTRASQWLSGSDHRKKLLDDLCEAEEIICGTKPGQRRVFYWTQENFMAYTKQEKRND